ncbi:hypothetical protein H257_15472 [Aphanomyces astaci]|uniref:DUF1279 domain-containing protein n=2 Tax=Aphanomyces astaci TaxID=112090 RepID=W4FMC6_APHAT|nr:hypothetical protein H257_15472 [Aphanomyces astaci]ETV68667.1 hypothetical protein H257_15472 [Aphanomyces astaci]|eukprot:XP_009841892.1 hypothetical protein H257_15472 [Aphanomyces astaci]
MLGRVRSIAGRQLRRQSSIPALRSACKMSTSSSPIIPSPKVKDNGDGAPLPSLDAAGVPTNESLAQKGKRFLKVYGMVGVVTHTALSVASYSLLYVSISRGLDVGTFLGSWTTSVQAVALANSTDQGSAGVEAASNAMVTYAIYKLLAPIRWPLTFFVTPIVVRQWNRLRLPPKDPKSTV